MSQIEVGWGVKRWMILLSLKETQTLVVVVLSLGFL